MDIFPSQISNKNVLRISGETLDKYSPADNSLVFRSNSRNILTSRVKRSWCSLDTRLLHPLPLFNDEQSTKLWCRFLYYNNGIRSQQEDIFYPLYTKLFFNYDIDPSIYLSARQRPNVSLYQSWYRIKTGTFFFRRHQKAKDRRLLIHVGQIIVFHVLVNDSNRRCW